MRCDEKRPIQDPRNPGSSRATVAPGALPFFPDTRPADHKNASPPRRGVIEECFEEAHKDDDPERIGNCPLVHLAPRHIKRLRDLKMIAGLKGAANNRRKYLSAMFGWAVEQDPPLLKSNPARDVRRVRYATSGFHTWTPDEGAAIRGTAPSGHQGALGARPPPIHRSPKGRHGETGQAACPRRLVALRA
jgi:hypothetical protein